MKQLILIISFFFYTAISCAQKDVCLNSVQNVYKVWTHEIENSKAGFYLKYNYEVQVKNSEGMDKNTAIMELMSDENNSIFQTKNLNVFQDQKYTVSIMDDKKIIVVNAYVGDAYKQQKIGQFQLLKDSMFQMLETQECKQVTFKGKLYKKVLLKANSKANKVYKIKTIEFLLDEELNRVKRVAINYVDNHKISVMKMEILNQKLDYHLTSIKKKALENVFSSNGELLTKYKEYQLIDNRN